MENTVQKVEVEVEKVVDVVGEIVEKAATEVKTEVVAEVAKAEILITDTEKLALREIENDFLKTRMEIERLEKKAAELQKRFPQVLEQLTKKYVTNPAEYVFNTLALKFDRRTPQAQILPPAPRQ